MKILMVAGESSGDAHGAALIQEFKQVLPDLVVYGIGGPLMLKEGLRAYYTLDALRVHGLIELIPHLPRLYKILWHLRDSLAAEQPDLAILVDYPGFNLKLAEQIKSRKIPVLWFSSPQVWAWRAGRIHKIAQFVDKIFVLFPFEEQIYRDVGMDVHFVGNPCLEDSVSPSQLRAFKKKYQLFHPPLIALALGSRPSEIKRHLPIVLETLSLLETQGMKAHYIFPVSESLELEWIEDFLKQSPVPVLAIQGAFLECIHAADLAIVASGTATLQTGLALTPFVIIYKVAPLTFWITKRLSHLPYIGMVNILAKRFIVPELLQNDLTPANLKEAIFHLWNDVSYQQQMIEGLSLIRTQLGEPGAYQRTAKLTLDFLLKSVSKKMVSS